MYGGFPFRYGNEQLTCLQGDTSDAPIPLLVFDNLRFEFREKGLPPEPSYNTLHAHSRPSDTTNLNDIARPKHKGKPLRNAIDGAVVAGDHASPPGSTNISTQQFVDGLAAPEASESHKPTSQLPQIPRGDCRPSPTEGKFGESIYGTICPAPPSTWSSSFAPRTSSQSPSRPGTAHKHAARPISTNSTAGAQSSTTRLQEALLRQQRELEMQQPSSVSDLPTTSISQPQPATSARRDMRLIFGRDMSPGIPSPFASSPSNPSTKTTATATFPIYDAPTEVPRQPRFGGVGEIPPSGQGE